MLVPHQIQGGSPIYSADLDTNGESYWLGTTYPLRVFHALIAEEIRVAAILPPAPPGSPPPAPFTEIRLNPSPGPFMALGHIWSALLLGYIGGRFAQFVYRRRTSEQPPEARK
jgi:hypothetical protein